MSDVFSDILGHAHVKAGLLHATRASKLHHALLFTGPSGIGKAMLARAFVQAMFCEHAVPGDLVRCGTCRNCTRVAAGIHPDVLEIDEEYLRNAYETASNKNPSVATIKIEVIRELQKTLMCRPFESPRRFVIIHDVHKMQDAAANCFLKTLEEPPENTSFILLTSQIQGLISTIISRCQVVRFAPFSMDEVSAFLVSHGEKPEIAEQIAALSDGSFGTAMKLAAGDYKDEILDVFSLVLDTGSVMEAFGTAGRIKDRMSKESRDAKFALYGHLLKLLSLYVRDVAVLKSSPESPVILRAYRDRMLRRLECTSTKDLMRAADNIQDVYGSIQNNANELVALERLVMGMHGVLF
ncbi:MAG: DNA polymerase III subunit delta' [Proteobacteria bacterium]|nr:DNA polymerase III subunit delta' [Pseudomonadota bacterium]